MFISFDHPLNSKILICLKFTSVHASLIFFFFYISPFTSNQFWPQAVLHSSGFEASRERKIWNKKGNIPFRKVNDKQKPHTSKVWTYLNLVWQELGSRYHSALTGSTWIYSFIQCCIQCSLRSLTQRPFRNVVCHSKVRKWVRYILVESQGREHKPSHPPLKTLHCKIGFGRSLGEEFWS